MEDDFLSVHLIDDDILFLCNCFKINMKLDVSGAHIKGLKNCLCIILKPLVLFYLMLYSFLGIQ